MPSDTPLSSNQMVGDARELDDQRQVLAEELGEWRDAGAPPEAVVDAIEAFVEAKVDHMSNFPPRQRMIDEGSLGMPTGTCPGTTRGNLGANSPAQRSSPPRPVAWYRMAEDHLTAPIMAWGDWPPPEPDDTAWFPLYKEPHEQPVETTVRQPCGPDDHLYVTRAATPIGDGVYIKCGAQEVK